MPLATLIVNPAAGRARVLEPCLPAIEARLGRRGYSMHVVATTADESSAASLAARAAADSALVIACGGDGTVHAAVQGLAGTGTPLGILPLGTHNALASSLALPPSPLLALERLLSFTPRTISLGRIENERGSRFFVTMAGCGPSGALAQALAGPKARLGRAAYPLHAARLFATRRWPSFQVEYRQNGLAWQSTRAAALLVSRVPSLGGVFAKLTPGASLDSPRLHAFVLAAPLHLALPAWFATATAGLGNPWLRRIEANELRCTPLGNPLDGSRAVLTQADAEPLGGLPCSLSVVPAALNLLMPGGTPAGAT